MGFSDKAKDPEFRNEIRRIRQKKTRDTVKLCIHLAFLIIAAGVVMFFASGGTDNLSESAATAFTLATVAAFAALPVFLLLSIIRLVRVIGDARILNSLNKESIDGVIASRQEWDTTRTDEHGYTYTGKNQRLVIITDEGKKIEIVKAGAYIPYVREGDKVRYHPGFPYPLEIYDKRESGKNICVFCGKANDAQRQTCDKCQKPMLI